MIVQGKRDYLVKPKSANYLQQTIPTSHKQVLMVDNSGHMVCHCEDKERIMHEVLLFIQRVGS